MRSRYFLALAPLALLLLSACKGPAINDAQRSTLVGTWESAETGATLIVYSNGVFTMSLPATSLEDARRFRGRIERGRDRIRISYDNAGICQGPGVYAFERTAIGLRFDPLDETCDARLGHFEQPWILRERIPSTPIPSL